MISTSTITLHLHLWQDMIDLCSSLDQDHYTFKSKLLNGASIGEHLRHSYEFYFCLLKWRETSVINYEKRERDRQIETDLAYAIDRILALQKQLQKITEDAPLQLSSKEASSEVISTSFERELVYCLDHAIHHQALIKIGLKELDCVDLVNGNFGVAYSTIRYRMQD